MDTPMKVKDKVSLFLCLRNDRNKNYLLPNIGFNILRNNDDDVNLGKMLSYNKWDLDTTCTRPILECKLIEAQHLVRR
jgi:hypothetical protein